MTRRTYSNKINEIEVSIAIEQLFVAPYPTAYTPAKIDCDNPPAGFLCLGSVVESTPQFKVARKMFELDAGIPSVTQYQAITGMSGEMSLTLHSNSWRKVQYAFGNYTSTCSPTLVSSISSVVSASQIFIAGASGTILGSLVVGRQFVIATSAANADVVDAFEARVTSITTVTSSGAGIGGFTLAINPPLTTRANSIASVLANAYTYNNVLQPIGGRAILNYALLGIADFIDGTQVVHEMMKCSAGGDFDEMIRPTQEGQIPLKFKMLGVDGTIQGLTELVVANRHYFPTMTSTT